MTAPRRPNPIALPSSTALRMVVVAVALVVSGLFVGTGLHNALDDSWARTILGCISGDPLDIESQLRCQAPAEQARAAVALGAAAVVGILAAVVLIAPGIVRSRRRLVPADRRFGPAVHMPAICSNGGSRRCRPSTGSTRLTPRPRPESVRHPNDRRIQVAGYGGCTDGWLGLIGPLPTSE